MPAILYGAVVVRNHRIGERSPSHLRVHLEYKALELSGLSNPVLIYDL